MGPSHGRFSTGVLLAAAFPLLAACDGSSPDVVAPDPVALVTLDPGSVSLELRDSTRLAATVTTASGSPVASAVVTWSSSAPAVAQVSGEGVVTGLAAGTATVTASVDGVSAQAAVTVSDWNVAEDAVVVDSTALDLLSDSTERATGQYRFRILQTPAPAIEAGDVIVGAQDLGFLRRVLSASVAGDEITLQTDPAALSDIIEEGGFETTIDFISAPGSPNLIGPLAPGEVRWGPVTFTPRVEGAMLTPAGISLSGTDICKELKRAGGPGCPKEVTKFEIKTGTFDFSPDLKVSASFSGLSLSNFRGVVDGTVNADFAVLLEASSSVSPIKPQIDLGDLTRPFYAMIGPVPVVGYAELGLKGGLEAKATAKGSIQAGFTNSHTVQVGATWDESAGWGSVFQSQRTFNAQLPSVQDGTLSGQIDVETKLFLKPEVKLIFYGVIGPFANIEPFGKFTLTFGTSACGMKSEAGINSEIGFTIPFLDPKVGQFSKKESPWFSWPGRSWDCPLGFLDVSTITNGSSPDPDGYTIVVDTTSKGSIGSTAQSTIQFVEVGKRKVRLDGVASNCTVQGSNPQEVTVNTGLVTPVPFQIDCKDPGGDLEVELRTTGTNLDPDGYRLTVGSQSRDVRVNETVVFQGLASGDHLVSLDGIAENCLLIGANPRTATVPTGSNAKILIEVQCAATQLVVQTVTTGVPAAAGWSIRVGGSQVRPIGPNGQVTFDLAPGDHQVQLLGLPANCSVRGANPRTVSLSGGQSTEVFDVDCAVGSLTVSVQTSGDPGPASTYTVDVGGQQQAVPVNGSVGFSSLPDGSVSVELLNVPGHCLVQGPNPRSGTVPGSVSFDVVCQAPVVCGSPPSPASFDYREITEQWDPSEPAPTISASIDREVYGDIAVQSSMTTTTTDQSASVIAGVGWSDSWKFIPVDQTRIGESVTLRIREFGRISRQVDPDDRTYAWATSGSTERCKGGQCSPADEVPGEDHPFDEIVDVPAWTLGSWNGFASYVAASTIIGPGNPGASAAASASIALEVVEVIDANGLPVPIVQMCTASGVDYRQ